MKRYARRVAEATGPKVLRKVRQILAEEAPRTVGSRVRRWAYYLQLGIRASFECRGMSRLRMIRLGNQIPFDDVKPTQLRLSGGEMITLSDRSELEAFREILLDREYDIFQEPITTILDCGANIGIASIFFRREHPDARIVAVEADPVTFQRLVANVNAECVHAAVTDHDGEIVFYRTPLSASSSTVKRGDAEPVTVPAVSLDVLLTRLGISHVGLLKLDIEGAEFDTLRAAPLDRVQRIIAEIHYDLGDGDEDELRGLLDGFPRSPGTTEPTPCDATRRERWWPVWSRRRVGRYSERRTGVVSDLELLLGVAASAEAAPAAPTVVCKAIADISSRSRVRARTSSCRRR